MKNAFLLFIIMSVMLLSFLTITGLIGCGEESKETDRKEEAKLFISNTIPKNNAKDVPTTAMILVTFNKDVVTPTIANLTFNPGVKGSISYDPGTRILTFKPSTVLSNNTDYSMTISGIADLDGNIGPPATINFTTSVPDTTPPSITFTSPENNQRDIGHDTKIMIRFNEPVDRGRFWSGLSFDPMVKISSDKWLLEWATGVNDEVTISPPIGIEPFDLDEEYTILISKDNVVDLSGNPMTTDYKLQFRTLRYPVEKIGNPNFSSPAVEPQYIYNVGRWSGKWVVVWGGAQVAGAPSGTTPNGTITASADGQILDSVETQSSRAEEIFNPTVTSGNGNRLSFQTPSLDNQKKFRIIFSSTSSYITFDLRTSSGTVPPQYVHIGGNLEHPSQTPFTLKNR